MSVRRLAVVQFSNVIYMARLRPTSLSSKQAQRHENIRSDFSSIPDEHGAKFSPGVDSRFTNDRSLTRSTVIYRATMNPPNVRERSELPRMPEHDDAFERTPVSLTEVLNFTRIVCEETRTFTR